MKNLFGVPYSINCLYVGVPVSPRACVISYWYLVLSSYLCRVFVRLGLPPSTTISVTEDTQQNSQPEIFQRSGNRYPVVLETKKNAENKMQGTPVLSTRYCLQFPCCSRGGGGIAFF
jgi:hypothetical protein